MSSLIPAKVFNETISLLSLGVDRPDSLRAAVYEISGYITFMARFCSLSRSLLRYDGSAQWKTFKGAINCMLSALSSEGEEV